MNILLAVASKHGATHGIADAIARELGEHGIDAHVRNLVSIHGLVGYDAVIFGSAVYMGHLMPEAHAFVEANEATLAAMPVWLFGSGQLGTEAPVPARPTDDLDHLADRIGARDHRMFGGRLDAGELGIGERIVTAAVHAPEGDFRDWEAIRTWARGIAVSLLGEQPEGTTMAGDLADTRRSG